MRLWPRRPDPPRGDGDGDGGERALRVVRAYHRRTKHDFQRFADGPGWLDWETQPDPFRRWRGARLVALDHPPEPDGEEGGDGPTWGELFVPGAVRPAPLDRAFVSRLFFDSLALSAWKRAGEAVWSLRVNPSSGNLHPTEGYLLCGPVEGLFESPVVAHYAPREHALEVRSEPDPELFRRLTADLPDPAVLVGLSSIHWRESWKYGERAFRYCNHDVGHALGAIGVAAAVLGWRARVLDGLGDDEVSALLGLADTASPEAEEPDCVVALYPGDARCGTTRLPAGACREVGALPRAGTPNDLSPDHVDWDAIDAVADATRKPAGSAPAPWSGPWGALLAPADDGTTVAARRLVRGRRSAVAMDGRTSIGRAAFERALERTLPGPERAPFDLLAGRPRAHLALFVHRVTGLEPGVYLLVRDPDEEAPLRDGLRAEFAWERVSGGAVDLPLFRLHAGDVRGIAARVSCGQDIAGDGCFSLGMLCALEAALEEDGPWAYRRLYWECGLVGQVLYLEAEAMGVRSTGIGCFFDEPVHAVLGVRGARWQSLYHFTVGGAVEDARVLGLPAYPAHEPG